MHSVETNSRRTVYNHLRSFRRHRPDDEVIYHHYRMPRLRLDELDVDLVVLNFCFLSRRNTDEFADILDQYGFLGSCACPVVAIPQDDFSCSALLDEWFRRWRVHSVYSPRSDGHEILYPHARRGASFHRVLPGYVDEEIVRQMGADLPAWQDRPIDLGTRVRFHPFQHGWFGRLKGQEAMDLATSARSAGLAVDVSTDPKAALLGLEWYRFLSRCRFTVARRGGSSLVDPYGLLKQRIERYSAKHPQADFAEVEAACFPGEDLEKPLTAMTPRVLDAALTRTCLILPEDDYEGLLEPWVHYLPLPASPSDYPELLDAMADESLAEALIEATYEVVVASGLFSYSRFVEDVTSVLDAPVKRQSSSSQSVDGPNYLDARARIEELPRRLEPALFEASRRLLLNYRNEARLGLIRHQLLDPSILTDHEALPARGFSAPEAEILRRVVETGAGGSLLAWVDGIESGAFQEWSLRPWFFETLEETA